MEQNRNTTWTTWHIPIFTHFPNIFKHPDFLALLSVRLREADSRRSEAAPEAPANLVPAAAKYIQDILDHQRQQCTISICKREVETMELRAEVVALRAEVANTTSSFKLMMEAVTQLLNSGSQSSSQHSPIGYPPLRPLPTSMTPTTTFVPATSMTPACPITPAGEVLAAALTRAALGGAAIVRASDRGPSVSEAFNCLPADGSLTVKKIIAEQVKYDSRKQNNGPIPQNIAKIISNRRPVALYAYFLARTKFESSQMEVEDSATASDNTKTHSVIKHLQNEKDSRFKHWAAFFQWYLDRLQQEGREAGDVDTIKYLDKRQSIAGTRAANKTQQDKKINTCS
ncbi:hypothetical protein BGZ97_001256 [Linnemannia gamsii]|uniref:Uncharacterized protein n=1 Tax=Linnemannia gamsii TaxID=64522 RepID=A0A9P6UJF9_9FUNG|nr:hypothetical protein BGZ97_001256 [Linnemannia gamsii]